MDLEKNVPEQEENNQVSDESQQQAENKEENVSDVKNTEEANVDSSIEVDSAENANTELGSSEQKSETEPTATAESATQSNEVADEGASPETTSIDPEPSIEAGENTPEVTSSYTDEESVETPETEESSEEEEQEEPIDYEALSKEELVDTIAELSKKDDPKDFDKHLKPLKARFDQIFEEEKAEALEKFIADGNEADDFEYKEDEVTVKFNDYYGILRSKRANYYADLEKRKEDNLKKKEEILEQIRKLIEEEETDVSIKGVKGLQEEWKKIGPVPGQHNKTLWANYNALLDRFYDARSIYFELKDLDRKKNLDQKLELCEKAEKLDDVENVKDAVIQLNELHEEFKTIGPVPRDDQEALWNRFKAASDKIYVKRKDFVDKLKESFEENLQKKLELATQLEEFINFDSDRINLWNKKTKEIQELQRKWEAIGGVPRQQAKEVNKRFWHAFKKFFANKSAFFKKFDSQREENLEKKRELEKRAEAMKESQDWNKTTNDFKKLQAEWKEIGPVPEKFRNSIYEEFKTACDYFFNQRRGQNSEQEKSYEENFKQKDHICNQIAALSELEINLEQIYDLIDQYNELGFVPRNQIKKAQARFNEVTSMILSSESLSDEDKEDFKMNLQVGKLRGGPHGNKKMFRKENSLKRKIENLENDINNWKTNMEFFASSKAADQFKADFEAKIEKASEEVQSLRKELRMLKNA